jgi:nucleoside-diphosphate-sugar epimerase
MDSKIDELGSSQQNFSTCIIFGGTGFIGVHIASFLLSSNRVDKIYLADIKPLIIKDLDSNLKSAVEKGLVQFVECDVRQKITNSELPKRVDLIINLAAIHRQPGHERNEYFETNIPGAENICEWATMVDCKNLIFTSSIAPYGEHEGQKSEATLPMPQSPYGISKLVAEKIHIAWKNSDNSRRLLIVRPGVIFGHGENGNVTRMVKAVLHGYFFYIGNKGVKKAGGYVKELVIAMFWIFDLQISSNKNFELFNFTMDPAPTLEQYVQAILKVSSKKRFIPNAPFILLNVASYIISFISKLLGIKQPIDPIRIKKLISANEILPSVLNGFGYKYHYTLIEAFEDWRKEWPEDWK